jgi:transposase
VRKYLKAQTPPVYQRHRPRPKKVTPYLDYLRRRWDEGCHNARQLYRELLSLGYSGSEGLVRGAVHPWRRLPRPPPQVRAPPFRWLLLSPARRLGEDEQWRLRRILEANPLLALGHRPKERFLQIVREGYVGGLEPWLQEAEDSGLPTFQALAKGLRRDCQAVRAALILPWSTAQCEGQICRLKLIKRIGYGRAKPDLLRQRVLHRLAASS